MTFPVHHAEARGILTKTSGFIAQAGFSHSLDRDGIRRLYEPQCAPIAERLAVVRRLRAAGIAVYATLAPLRPCDPDALIEMAIDATDRDIIADPFHARAVKTSGATTRAGRRFGTGPRAFGWLAETDSCI